MKNKVENFTISIDVNLTNYKSDNGKHFSLTQEELEDKVNSYIKDLIQKSKKSNKNRCIREDNEYQFETFQIDDAILKSKYDESNKKSYNHFIHKYLRDFYQDEDGEYDINSKLHKRMLSGKFLEYEFSVKETILMHLVSGNGVRYVGNEGSHRRVKKLETTEELKDFLRFILDSKMFDVNEKYIMPEGFKKSVCDFWYLESQSGKYNTIGELLVLECWRNCYNIEVIEWLHNRYGMNLRAVEDTKEMKYSIIPRIIKSVYRNDIINKQNDFDTNEFYEFAKFVNYLTNKYKDLPLINRWYGIDDKVIKQAKTWLYKDVPDGIKIDYNVEGYSFVINYKHIKDFLIDIFYKHNQKNNNFDIELLNLID